MMAVLSRLSLNVQPQLIRQSAANKCTVNKCTVNKCTVGTLEFKPNFERKKVTCPVHLFQAINDRTANCDQQSAAGRKVGAMIQVTPIVSVRQSFSVVRIFFRVFRQFVVDMESAGTNSESASKTLQAPAQSINPCRRISAKKLSELLKRIAGIPIAWAAWQLVMLSSTKRQFSMVRFKWRAAPE